MFPWFSRLSYWLLVRNLRLSWDRGGSLITLKSNVQCDFDTAHSRVLIEKLNWLQESDELTTFLIISHSPSMTQPLPWCSLLRRHNDHDVLSLRMPGQASGVSWQRLWSMSGDFSVSSSQGMTHSGQHRLWPTAEHNYYVSLNNQSATQRATVKQFWQTSNQWLLTILTDGGQHSWWGSCVKGRVLCSCLQRLVVT